MHGIYKMFIIEHTVCRILLAARNRSIGERSNIPMRIQGTSRRVRCRTGTTRLSSGRATA